MPDLNRVPEQVLFGSGTTQELFRALDTPLRQHGFAVNWMMARLLDRVDMPFSATPSFNAALGRLFVMTLTANITSSTITNPRTGPITLLLKQDGTGGRTWAAPANLKLAGGALALSAGANKVDSVTAVYDGTNWYEISRSLNM